MKDKLPSENAQVVRAWYGLPAEIAVENELWHLVRVAGVPLNHPPVVNLVLRRGLPRAERLYLSFLHEFGHLQTLPIAVIHSILLLTLGRWWKGGLVTTIRQLATAWVAHEAVWELSSEAYVMVKAGQDYRRIYRDYPNPVGQLAFWMAMIALASLLTYNFLRPSGRHEHLV